MPRVMKDVWTLVEFAREALMERRRRNLVFIREPSFSSSWSGQRLDVPAWTLVHVSWVSHLGVVLLSHLPKFHSSMRLLCP